MECGPISLYIRIDLHDHDIYIATGLQRTHDDLMTLPYTTGGWREEIVTAYLHVVHMLLSHYDRTRCWFWILDRWWDGGGVGVWWWGEGRKLGGHRCLRSVVGVVVGQAGRLARALCR